MRIRLAILLGLVFAALTVRADDEKFPVLKVGAEVYSNVTVTSVTPTDIYFTHASGMANAKLKSLEPALQKHFNYNAAKAEAVEKDRRSPPAPTPGQAGSAANIADPQAAMDDAIARVKVIINQPVTQLPRTPGMHVALFNDPGWFHPGAFRPDFNSVDVRTSQEFTYDQYQFISSDANPGVAFRGPDCEFNAMTKYFYTDRSLPKKKLTEAEMVEINRLYRIIGSCEAKLNPAPAKEASPAEALVYLSAHRNAVIGGAAGLLVFLLVVRFMMKDRAGA